MYDSDSDDSLPVVPSVTQFGDSGGARAHGGGTTAGSLYGGPASRHTATFNPNLHNARSADLIPTEEGIPVREQRNPDLSGFVHPINLNAVPDVSLSPNDHEIYSHMLVLITKLQECMRSKDKARIENTQAEILQFAEAVYDNITTHNLLLQQRGRTDRLEETNNARVAQSVAILAARKATRTANQNQLGLDIMEQYDTNFGVSPQVLNVHDIAKRWDDAILQAAAAQATVQQATAVQEAAVQQAQQRAADRAQQSLASSSRQHRRSYSM